MLKPLARRNGIAVLVDTKPTFTFTRAVTYEILNLYAVKMAAVFMISADAERPELVDRCDVVVRL
jgi:hypothetical protein